MSRFTLENRRMMHERVIAIRRLATLTSSATYIASGNAGVPSTSTTAPCHVNTYHWSARDEGLISKSFSRLNSHATRKPAIGHHEIKEEFWDNITLQYITETWATIRGKLRHWCEKQDSVFLLRYSRCHSQWWCYSWWSRRMRCCLIARLERCKRQKHCRRK